MRVVLILAIKYNLKYYVYNDFMTSFFFNNNQNLIVIKNIFNIFFITNNISSNEEI